MAVFGVAMMMRMVTWRLKQPNALKKGDDRPVFHGRAMCPLVDLVGIRAQNHEKPNAPGENATHPGRQQKQKRET